MKNQEKPFDVFFKRLVKELNRKANLYDQVADHYRTQEGRVGYVLDAAEAAEIFTDFLPNNFGLWLGTASNISKIITKINEMNRNSLVGTLIQMHNETLALLKYEGRYEDAKKFEFNFKSKLKDITLDVIRKSGMNLEEKLDSRKTGNMPFLIKKILRAIGLKRNKTRFRIEEMFGKLPAHIDRKKLMDIVYEEKEITQKKYFSKAHQKQVKKQTHEKINTGIKNLTNTIQDAPQRNRHVDLHKIKSAPNMQPDYIAQKDEELMAHLVHKNTFTNEINKCIDLMDSERKRYSDKLLTVSNLDWNEQKRLVEGIDSFKWVRDGLIKSLKIVEDKNQNYENKIKAADFLKEHVALIKEEYFDTNKTKTITPTRKPNLGLR